jgi:glycosyltransferase involved in cell wall biosynthesis
MLASTPTTAPKITVVTVCFNSAATIADAIRSVRDQTWPNVEHIVIDGASKDSTLAEIAPYRDDIDKLVSEPDGGIYDAMNKGLSLATGDVVAFLNSDDKYTDVDVLTAVAVAFNSGELDAVFGDVDFVRAEAPERVVRRYSSRGFQPGRLAGGWMPAHPGLFIRKAVFDRVGPFKADYRIAGDFEFVARAFGRGNLHYAYLPRVLVRMRLGGASTSGLGSLIRLNREVLRACRENGIRTSIWRLLLKYPTKLLELVRR